jgi:hypothetical protein
MTALVTSPVLVERSVVPMAVELGVPHLDILENYHCSLFIFTWIEWMLKHYTLYFSGLFYLKASPQIFLWLTCKFVHFLMDFPIGYCSCNWDKISIDNLWRTPSKVVSSNPVHGEVYLFQHYVIEFVSDLRQVGGFFRVLRFPPPIILTCTI